MPPGLDLRRDAVRTQYSVKMKHRSDKPLVVVDGSSYLFRAFHALPPLSNSRGEPTGAIYGVLNMLRRLLQDDDPRWMAVVFDAAGKTFREALYAPYKANRPPMPPELAQQIEPLRAAIEALGIPILTVPEVEADDVIGTLSRLAEQAGIATVIASGDKDLAQLVSDRVTLLDTMQDVRLDRAGVARKYGVTPEQMVDYLALLGDKVDNVPGVPGVGPKTAGKWLAAYGSLDGVLAHADELGGKAGAQLRAGREQLSLSRRLVTIRRDVPLGIGPTDLTRSPPDQTRLRQLFQRWEFVSWLRQLEAPATDTAPAPRYETILTEQALDRWVARLEAASLVTIDTETSSLDYMEAEIVGVSFALEERVAAYVPVGHLDPEVPGQLARDRVLGRLRALLEDPQRAKLGQNLKYDMNVLARHGIELRGIVHDTMLESYVLDSTASRHDMDSLALKYLHHRTIRYEDVAGKGARQVTFDRVPIARAATYAAEDADVTLRLHHALWPRLSAQPSLARLYRTLEIPLVPVLSRLERNGVLIDADRLYVQGVELAARMRQIEGEAHRAAGGAFNIASPKQIQAVLYEWLRLPVSRKTPTGQP